MESMSRKKMLIIPVFIPFGGCAHKCVFCDQTGITGKAAMPGENEAAETIEKYLSTWKGGGRAQHHFSSPRPCRTIKTARESGAGRVEVAFYGGSFTGLPFDVQKKYLNCAARFVMEGRVHGIRVSTRPDYVSEEIALFLKENRVSTVELGAQSMSEEVLKLSGRGHTAKETAHAVKTLKDSGFNVGLQFMPGLPGDTFKSIVETAEAVIALRPDFVRVYPTLVLKGTPLHRMYLDGEYSAWGLDDMVEACKEVFARLGKANIPVIRAGLQTTDGLLENLVAGPHHPSFRQLVERIPL